MISDQIANRSKGHGCAQRTLWCFQGLFSSLSRLEWREIYRIPRYILGIRNHGICSQFPAIFSILFKSIEFRTQWPQPPCGRWSALWQWDLATLQRRSLDEHGILLFLQGWEGWLPRLKDSPELCSKSWFWLWLLLLLLLLLEFWIFGANTIQRSLSLHKNEVGFGPSILEDLLSGGGRKNMCFGDFASGAKERRQWCMSCDKMRNGRFSESR